MKLILAVLFTANLIASITMTRQVFPRLSDMVMSGVLSPGMKAYGLFGLMLEGVVSLTSFVVLFDRQLVNIDHLHLWMLGFYAFSNLNIFMWVTAFHIRRWEQW